MDIEIGLVAFRQLSVLRRGVGDSVEGERGVIQRVIHHLLQGSITTAKW